MKKCPVIAYYKLSRRTCPVCKGNKKVTHHGFLFEEAQEKPCQWCGGKGEFHTPDPKLTLRQGRGLN